ncbi:MAG: RHS repeat-associated protein [Alteromonadaceae bacterium]|jgi:RHS repeat-associated protein
MKNFIYILSLLTLLGFTVVSQAEIVYIHNDGLGSPIMETNEQGTVISRSHYKPFGETLEPMKEGVGYTGHLNDTDLGLTYMQARYYDPVIGRFYSNDPVGFNNVHNFNRYTYANNNPYKYTDPDGENPLIIFGAAVGAITAVTTTILQNGSDTTLAQIGGAAIGGGIMGAIAGATMGASLAAEATVATVIATTGTAGISGFAGDVIGQGVAKGGVDNIDFESAALTGILSTVGGSTGAATKILGAGLKTQIAVTEVINVSQNGIVKPAIEKMTMDKVNSSE